MTEEMKPCPFCGSHECETDFSDRGPLFVRCYGCWARGPEERNHDDHEANFDDALSAWNTRSPTLITSAGGDAENEALRSAIAARPLSSDTGVAKLIVTPEEFEAVGNGVIDDTDALQKAIDALAAYAKWQRWLGQDHEDSAVISRAEIVSLLLLVDRRLPQSDDYARGWKDAVEAVVEAAGEMASGASAAGFQLQAEAYNTFARIARSLPTAPSISKRSV